MNFMEKIIISDIAYKVRNEKKELNTNQKKLLIYKCILEKKKEFPWLKINQKFINTVFFHCLSIPITSDIALEEKLNAPEYSLYNLESLNENYQKILSAYATMAQNIEIWKPLELSYFYTLLLWNGYFSQNQQYFYNKKNRILDGNAYFYRIMTGNGVCLENAKMLSDFLRINHINTNIMPNCMIKDDIHIEKIIDINKKYKQYPSLKEKRIDQIINTKDNYIYGNHMIDLIEDLNGELFLFDPTNLCVLNLDSPQKASIINGTGTYTLKPFISLFYFSEEANYELLNELLSKKTKQKISASKIENSYQKVFELYKENTSDIVQTYDGIHQNIENICNEIKTGTQRNRKKQN